MSTIRETVRDTLAYEGFASYADHTAAWATIKALEERERTIIATIIERLSLTEEQADQLLAHLELIGEPVTEPEPEPETTDAHIKAFEEGLSTETRLTQLAGVVDNLTDMVTRLVNAATRNGIAV